jgi:hypothetical protein
MGIGFKTPKYSTIVVLKMVFLPSKASIVPKHRG